MNASQLLEVATEVSAETKTPDGRWAGSGQSAQVPYGRARRGTEEKATGRTSSPRKEVGAGPVRSLPPKGSLEKMSVPSGWAVPSLLLAQEEAATCPRTGASRHSDHPGARRCPARLRRRQAGPGSVLLGPREPVVRMTVGAQGTDVTVDTGAEHSGATRPCHRDRPPSRGLRAARLVALSCCPNDAVWEAIRSVIHGSQVTFTSHGQVALTLRKPEARIATLTDPQGE